VRPDTCGDIDFHTQEWSGAALDPILYGHGQDAYDTFVKLTGESRVPGNDGTVRIEYPTVLIWNTPYTTWNTIHWQWHGDGKLGLSALDHEFGHRLRHAADGDTDHFYWDATRFRYLRNHSSRDVTNDGFAFNEGWAEYHKTLRHAGSVSTTWSSPTGDNVEGDVASQLLRLANACGGFARLWATMKSAGANSFHSIDEFRAEFMKRNPTCSDTAPGSTAPPAPSPSPAGAPSAPAAPDAKLTAAVRAELADRVKLRALPRLRGNLRPTASLPSASQSTIEALGDRHTARREQLRERAVGAHARALDSLVSAPDALTDGSYAKRLAAARSQLAKDLAAAVADHAADTRKDLSALRAKATEPSLASYLDSVTAAYARAETEARAPSAQLDLPASFWPTTATRR
jgi:hypothetical protein